MIFPPPQETNTNKKPSWLKIKFPSHSNYFSVAALLEKHNLHSICRSAKCPNITECWTHKTATFLVLGDTCTRGCAFCAVAKGRPVPPRADEPREVAEAAATLGLSYVVVTSVTRDDLPDGGSSHFVRTIEALRAKIPGIRIEVLVPDFGGCADPLASVVGAGPDILNHNLETTETSYPGINRPAGNYRRSLDLLLHAKALGAATKSGLMVGLGETGEDLMRTLLDLRQSGCDLLTLGQYLQPTRGHAPVAKYYAPEEFAQWKAVALDMGFADVEAGPLIRSSFHAHKLYETLSRIPKSHEHAISDLQ